MQRKNVLRITALLIGAMLVLPVYAFIYNQGTHQVSQTIVNVYNGVEIVQVTGSIPNEMDRTQLGVFGGIFWNPTNSVYQITRVEFNASSAPRQVFRGIAQGNGLSTPTSGWMIDAGRTVYSTTVVNVQPHTAQEFYVRIRGNNVAATFRIDIRITANATVYHQPYETTQANRDVPLSTLWLGTGFTPQFTILATRGEVNTFYVSLQEDSNRALIGSNGKLTIQVPSEFTNVQDIGGNGWGAANITDNIIEVSNTVSVRESYITYAFKATTPTHKGLYLLSAAFSGTPNEHPVGNFSVLVTDAS